MRAGVVWQVLRQVLTLASQRFQSGVINDYITWLVTGVAAIGAVLALIVPLKRPLSQLSLD